MRPFTNSHLPDLHGLPEWLLSFIVTVPSLASVRPSRGISSPRVRWTRAAAAFAATAGVFCLPQFGPPRSERTVTVSGKRLRKRRTWERIQLSEAHTLATSSLPKTSSAIPCGFLPAPSFPAPSPACRSLEHRPPTLPVPRGRTTSHVPERSASSPLPARPAPRSRPARPRSKRRSHPPSLAHVI